MDEQFYKKADGLLTAFDKVANSNSWFIYELYNLDVD